MFTDATEVQLADTDITVYKAVTRYNSTDPFHSPYHLTRYEVGDTKSIRTGLTIFGPEDNKCANSFILGSSIAHDLPNVVDIGFHTFADYDQAKSYVKHFAETAIKQYIATDMREDAYFEWAILECVIPAGSQIVPGYFPAFNPKLQKGESMVGEKMILWRECYVSDCLTVVKFTDTFPLPTKDSPCLSS
jgi:hypothetical protein